MNFKKIICAILFIGCAASASALEANSGDFAFKLNGYGTIMSLTSDNTSYLPADFRVRGQASYSIKENQTIGAVYSIDPVSYTHLDVYKRQTSD